MSEVTKDNAVKFVAYMCDEDCAFSKVSKQLGTFSAVLFYLREYEKWLKKIKTPNQKDE